MILPNESTLAPHHAQSQAGSKMEETWLWVASLLDDGGSNRLANHVVIQLPL